VPAHIASAVHRALEKLPADRPNSAEAFALALDGAPSGEMMAPTRVSITRRLVPWMYGSAIGAAMTAAIAAVWTRAVDPAAPVSEQPIRFDVNAPDSMVTAAVCCGRMFAFDPAGKTLFYQSFLSNETTTGPTASQFIVRRDLGSTTQRRFEGTDGARSLSVSPDGSAVAYTRGRQLVTIGSDGTNIQEHATLPDGYIGGTAWRDMDWVLVPVGTQLIEVNIRTRERRVVVPPDSLGRQPTGVSVVAGTETVLFAYADLTKLPSVYVMTKRDKKPRRLMDGASPEYVAAWNALVVNRRGEVFAFPFNPATGDTLGSGVRIMGGVINRSPVLAHAEYAFAANGTHARLRRLAGPEGRYLGTSMMLYRGSETREVTAGPSISLYRSLRYSPDGKRIIVLADVGEGGSALYLVDAHTGASQPISDREEVVSFGWVGNDSVLYAVSGSLQLRQRAADGSGSVTVLPPITGFRRIDDMTVTGDVVLLMGLLRPGATLSDIAWVSRQRGGAATPYLTSPLNEADASLSPDGKWCVFGVTNGEVSQVFVTPFPNPTGRVLVSPAGGRAAIWLNGGTRIAYVDEQNDAMIATFTPSPRPSVGPPTTLRRAMTGRWWDAAPDQSSFAILSSIRLNPILGIEVTVNDTIRVRPPR
jgi:serine/threonine-protein kinase